MERLDFRPSEVTEAYVGAYNEQWEDYNRNI